LELLIIFNATLKSVFGIVSQREPEYV